MKDGICPKCSSAEVYRGVSGSSVSLQITATYVQPATKYICTECGYYEFYAMPGHDLEKIRTKYEKVKNQ